MQEIGHFIGGKRVAGGSGRFAEVYNPATGRVCRPSSLSPRRRTRRGGRGRAEGQPAWAATNPQRRARVMMRFVDLLNRDMDRLAESLSREHGKTLPTRVAT